MSHNIGADSSEDESLKDLFSRAMKLFDNIENSNEATNSDATQLSIKAAIAMLEKATNLVSISGMFSTNETVEELPADTLQYLLLPALLGNLSLKLCGRPRKEVIDIAEIYFKDFLRRCRDYGLPDAEEPPEAEAPRGPPSERDAVAQLVGTRDAKIRRYRQQKETAARLAALQEAVAAGADDATARDCRLVALAQHAARAQDELLALRRERPALAYAAAAPELKPRPRPPPPLRSFTIAGSEARARVFGGGYPAQPAMSVAELYESRVREGLFPAPGSIASTAVQSSEAREDEREQEQRERLAERDDPEERERLRRRDEHRDQHRRGWGNRHNRS